MTEADVMGNSWVGTRWRSVSVKMRFGETMILPGDEFVFTEEMAERGLVPDIWVSAGNAEFIPDGVTLAPAPKDEDEHPAAGDAERAAPVRRKKDRHAWITAGTVVDEETAGDVLLTETEVPDDGNTWAL